VIQAHILLSDGAVTAEGGDFLTVPWWSFSKTVIAATALRLVDQGRLSLDEPRDGATLRQLLRHEAGLRDYGAVPAYQQAVAADEPPWPRRELLDRARADDLLFAPGEGWSYSNIGYLKVRERIEAAYGDLKAAAAELVLDATGVIGAWLAEEPNDLSGVEMGEAQTYDPGWVYHGLFVGPLIGAAHLLEALLGETSPLSQTSRAAMLQTLDLPQFVRPPWTAAAYGLGLMAPTSPEGWTAAGHTGGGPGSSVAVYRRMDGISRSAAVFETDESETGVETLACQLLSTGAA
jgi:CubicO group peptidase (beta-lactamase class C family)